MKTVKSTVGIATTAALVQAQEPVAWRFDGFGEDEIRYASAPHNIDETGRTWTLSPDGWTPLYRAPVQPVAVPDVWISELVGGIADELSYGHGYRQGFNDCRAKVLELNDSATTAQDEAKDTGTNDKALLDFMETDFRLHIATTYVGLSYVPTFEVAKMTGCIGNDQLTHISSGKSLREAIAAAIAASSAGAP